MLQWRDELHQEFNLGKVGILYNPELAWCRFLIHSKLSLPLPTTLHSYTHARSKMTYRFFFFLSILFASVCVADDAEIIDLHKSLVSIQSTTKTGDPQTDERNVQTFIENWLKETAEKNNFKISIERQQVTEGRDNLYVYTGTERSTSVMMTSHVDTVSPHFGYRVEGDKIYGRGTNDAKGCVAAMMIAFRDLIINKQVKEEGDLSLLFVVGEEIGGEGMTEVPKLGLTWDTVVFGEPTDSKLASGQIGGMVFNVTTLGKTVHSGFPELGINAIDRLRMIMDALHLVLDELDSNPKYGQNSLTLAQIRGGVADNAVPPSAWVSGSYRLTISPSQVVEKIGRLINEKVCPKTQYDPKDPEKPCKSVAVKYPLQEDPLDIDHDVPGKPVLSWLNQT